MEPENPVGVRPNFGYIGYTQEDPKFVFSRICPKLKLSSLPPIVSSSQILLFLGSSTLSHRRHLVVVVVSESRGRRRRRPLRLRLKLSWWWWWSSSQSLSLKRHFGVEIKLFGTLLSLCVYTKERQWIQGYQGHIYHCRVSLGFRYALLFRLQRLLFTRRS